MTRVRFGAGFRTPHFAEIARAPRAVDWLEVVTENFLGIGGKRRAMLETLRSDHSLILHGVSLDIAGSDALDEAYLRDLRALCDRVEPAFVSDHLCWTSYGGRQSHDLLPLAFTRPVLDHVAARVAHVQEALGRRLTLENASVYVAFRDDEMGEPEFLRELARRSGCGILLDVNNLYVNAQNLGIDPLGTLATLTRESVDYMHLAGHAVLADVRIDTHDADVPADVYALFAAAVRAFPGAGVIVERDENLPTWAELCAEVDRARARHAGALASVEPRRIVPRENAGSVRASGNASDSWVELQAEFWKRTVERDASALADRLDDDRPVPAARGLRVYSDAWATSLPRALATNFPALARVVSPADWSALCTAYLRAHPPRGHDFRGLGRALAEFVRDFPFADGYGVETRVLAELVALEQAQLDVQDEIDEGVPITPDALAALTPEQWERADFVFVRALRIVRASHDVLGVVEAVARGETPSRPKAEVNSYLVLRSADQLRTQRISERDAELLSALFDGKTFGEACDEAHALEAVRVLVEASQRGLILRCSAG